MYTHTHTHTPHTLYQHFEKQKVRNCREQQQRIPLLSATLVKRVKKVHAMQRAYDRSYTYGTYDSRHAHSPKHFHKYSPRLSFLKTLHAMHARHAVHPLPRGKRRAKTEASKDTRAVADGSLKKKRELMICAYKNVVRSPIAGAFAHTLLALACEARARPMACCPQAWCETCPSAVLPCTSAAVQPPCFRSFQSYLFY